MSKRTVVMSSILAAILMATVITGTVFAAGPQDPEGTSKGMRGNATTFEDRGFVDADGDGVNDRYGQTDGTQMLEGAGSGHAYGFVDENGDGVNDRLTERDGTQMLDGTGYAHGFVDADADGVCDRGGRNAQGDGMPDLDGENFVDANNDGVCDNCGDGDCEPGTGENAGRLSEGRGDRNR